VRGTNEIARALGRRPERLDRPNAARGVGDDAAKGVGESCCVVDALIPNRSRLDLTPEIIGKTVPPRTLGNDDDG